jgi:hypothetical protein
MFIKLTQGVFIHGKWFCSEHCGDKDPDIKQMKDLYSNGIEFKNNNDNEDSDSLNEEEFEL